MLWRRTSARRRPRVMPLGMACIAGAALAYLADPDKGRRRRAMARERSAATLRRTGRAVKRFGRRTGAELYGWKQKALHLRPEETTQPDDVTLAHAVESEIFRDPDVPKGRINVNAEYGIVVLRGELDRPELIRELESATRKVRGVLGVENLLHLRGTPAPHRAQARMFATAGSPR